MAGLFFALDPLPLLQAAYILTDTLFAFLVTSALLAGVWALRSRMARSFLTWGLLIGVATLTRPLFKYYAAVPILTIVLSRWSIRAIVRDGLACLLGIVLILGPWMVRNKIQLDFWGLELNQGLSMVWSTFRLTHSSSPAERQAEPELAAARDIVANSKNPAGILQDVERQLKVPEVVADRYLQRIGIENVLRNPVAFLEIAGKNAINMLTSPATAQELMYRSGLVNESFLSVRLEQAVKERLLLPPVVNIASRLLCVLVFCVGAAWGYRVLWRDKNNRLWLTFLGLTCVYVVALTSAVAGYDRFRLPIEGILWILFAALVLKLRRAAPVVGKGSIPRA